MAVCCWWVAVAVAAATGTRGQCGAVGRLTLRCNRSPPAATALSTTVKCHHYKHRLRHLSPHPVAAALVSILPSSSAESIPPAQNNSTLSLPHSWRLLAPPPPLPPPVPDPHTPTHTPACTNPHTSDTANLPTLLSSLVPKRQVIASPHIHIQIDHSTCTQAAHSHVYHLNN